LQDVISSRCTFICINALDEGPPGDPAKLLDSLKPILQESSSAQIFLTRKPRILSEVERHPTERAATRSTTPTKNDLTTFLRAKLKEDAMPGAMDQSSEEEIIRNIPGKVSEMCVSRKGALAKIPNAVC